MAERLEYHAWSEGAIAFEKGMEPTVKVELIAARSADGATGLARAAQAGHSDLLDLYQDLIPQTSLPEAMKTELTTGGNPAR